MRVILVLLVFVALGLPIDAAAAPCDPAACNCTASKSDIELFNAHGCEAVSTAVTPPMWFPRFYFHRTFWDVPGDRGWISPDRGFSDACNINRDFAKHWNAAFLVEEGLEPNFTDNNIPWHGIVDYTSIGRGGKDTAFHSRYAHRVLTANISFPNRLAEYTPYSFFGGTGRESITYCGVYGNRGVSDRAAIILHEGWHGWQEKHNYKFHFQGPRGACTVGGLSCDFMYLHNLDDFAIGQLAQFTPDGRRFHSPAQIESEFHCDVFTTSNSLFVSNFTLANANASNVRVNPFLINGPAPGCGTPRPFSSP
jgi:hypothetical protein